MRLTIAAAAVLCAGSTPPRRPQAARRSSSTKRRWTFTDTKDGKLKELIDADGNYIAQTIGDKHIDHGTSGDEATQERASPAR